jgi:hypothetical protein
VDCRKGEKYINGLFIDSGNAFDEQGEEEEQEATFDDYPLRKNLLPGIIGQT